jgi:ribonuclease VapC
VVHGEPDAERFLAAPQSDAVTMSAVSLTEASIVAEARQGPDAGRDLELLALQGLRPWDTKLPVGLALVGIALMLAWWRFRLPPP